MKKMNFDEWQAAHGPNGGAYDIEMQRAGWNGRQAEIDRLRGIMLHDISSAILDCLELGMSAAQTGGIVKEIIKKALA